MIWPLLSFQPTVLPDSDDAYFSVWRLAWVAHQLPRDPEHLFDANIFYPATDTLAFSDAMLLVGIAGAPLLWLGIDPVLTHNVLMAAAFLSSMAGMFLLVRHLTASAAAAWTASIVFGFAPYRFAHIGHLELQWVVWMPISVWFLHRLIDEPRRGMALALGFSVAAQTLCSIYYGVFLVVYLGAAGLALLALRRTAWRRMLTVTPLVVLPLLLVVLIYGTPYASTRAQHGARSTSEVAEYSATLGDFFRVPPANRLRGAKDGRPAPDERALFPGVVALCLAGIALLRARSGLVWAYVGLTAISIDATLGVNGLLFSGLREVLPILTSLRSPARFGVLVLLSVAVLAGFGAAQLYRLRPRLTLPIAAGLTVLCLAEYWSAPVVVRAHSAVPTEAHRWLSYQPAGTVVLEMPVPRSDRLWLYETTYQVRSIHHWQPLVNGYSGFAPREYTQTLEQLSGFPDATAVRRLRELGVRFVLLNRVYYSGQEFTELIGRLTASPAFWPPQSFGDGDNQIVVVELKDATDSQQP
jgi:hypothetical protein